MSKILKIRLVFNDINGSCSDEFLATEPLFDDIKKEIQALGYQTSVGKEISVLLEHNHVSNIGDVIDPAIEAIQAKFHELWS